MFFCYCCHYTAIIVNSNPGDRSSSLIKSYKQNISGTLFELESNEQNYWAANINIGIKHLFNNNVVKDGDLILLLNADLRFNNSFFTDIISYAHDHPKSIFVANTIVQSSGKPASSGIIMRSWLFSYSVHPKVVDIDVSATMLVGRSLCIPVELVKIIGYLNSKLLPHYGADYEYSYRAYKLGYNLYITNLVKVYMNADNTGIKSTKVKLLTRVVGLFSIKSTYNLKYRINYIKLTHPNYAIITGIIITVIKCISEAVIGRHAYLLRGNSKNMIN